MASSFALYTSTALVTPVFAQPAPPAELATDFSFDHLSARMKTRAGQPYEPPAEELPESFSSFDYDGYRRIQYRPDHSKWSDSGAFRIQAFHMGWLFKERVGVYEIKDGKTAPVDFSAADFDYHEPGVEEKVAADPWPGVAGFRINAPINTPDLFDEVVSYLGASYFRALGRGNLYGLSARGIVLNSWVEGPEEFPRFSEFYLERPAADSDTMVFYAALEGPSVTGAYKFSLIPASAEMQETIIEVTARLFFRADIKELGIAPLTSMFLYADNNRSAFDDYRPQVHDSDGLVLEDGAGQVSWRPLNNPPEPGNSYFQQEQLGAFGLYQRNRNFDDYQDAGAHYEKRPSLRVEPIGSWGAGAVRLIEIPAKLEAEDNIGAFFVPSEPVKAGDEREFSYRLRWGDLNPDPAGGLAYVTDTRGGRGGVSGVSNADTLRKFVIDFKGGPLTTLDEKTPPDIVTDITGGTLKVSTVSRITDDGIWRLVLDVEIPGTDPVELKALLTRQGRPVTETWLYQWRAAA